MLMVTSADLVIFSVQNQLGINDKLAITLTHVFDIDFINFFDDRFHSEECLYYSFEQLGIHKMLR